MTFANLPASLDPNEPSMELWEGKVSDIPALLQRRKSQAARNWYSTATFPDSHPFANKIRKELKQLSGIIVEREVLAQAEFTAEIQKEYAKRLAYVEGSAINGGNRTKKLIKLKRLFEGSRIEGLP